MDERHIRTVVSLAAAVDRVAALHRQAAEDCLRQEGVPQSLAGLLWILSDDEAGLSMRDLAQHLACDPSNVTLLAAQMEKQGLADRVPDARDARRRVLSLTARGSEVARRMTTAVASSSPLSGLTAAQVESVRAAVTP